MCVYSTVFQRLLADIIVLPSSIPPRVVVLCLTRSDGGDQPHNIFVFGQRFKNEPRIMSFSTIPCLGLVLFGFSLFVFSFSNLSLRNPFLDSGLYLNIFTANVCNYRCFSVQRCNYNRNNLSSLL